MPVFEFTGPDGKTYEVTAPEGATHEQAFQVLRGRIGSQENAPKDKTLLGAITGSNTVPEWGSAVTDRVKAIFDPQTYKNIASELSPSAWNKVATNRSLFEGATSGGQIGTGLDRQQLYPERTASAQKGLNDLVGNLFMAPVQKVSGAAISTLFPKTAEQTAKESLLKTVGEAGYSIPRADINQTWLTNLLNRFGGKEGIESATRVKNQPITNKLAAKALGLADDAPVTPEVLKGLRDKAGEAYNNLANLGPLKTDKAYLDGLRGVLDKYSGASKDFPELASQQVTKLVKGLMKKDISSEGAVEMVKNLRKLGEGNLKSLAPADKLLGKAQQSAANVLDDLLARNIPKGSNLFETYKQARQLIAKTYTVERALNPATGNVSAQEIARQAKKGIPLTNELKTIAEYGRGFPRVAKEPIGPPPAGGLLEPLIYGTGGTVFAGPAGSAAAMIPIIGKPIARTFGSTVPKLKDPAKEIPQHLLIPRIIAGRRQD